MMGGWIISFVAGLCVNAFVIWIVAKKIVSDREKVTFVSSLICALLLSWVAFAVGILMLVVGFPVMIVAMFMGPIVMVVVWIALILGYLFLFLKWGASTVNKSFDIERGGSTILVLYLVIQVVLGVVVNLATEDGEDSIASLFGSDRQSEYDDYGYGDGSAALAPDSTGDHDEYFDPQPQTNTTDQLALAENLIGKASNFWKAKQYAEAVAAAQEALTIYQSIYPETHEKVVKTKQMIQAAQGKIASLGG